jgi:uncharacterized membrane protein
MTFLAFGVLLFAFVHFIPSLAPSVKASALQKIGENGYKGVFSLLLLISIALIIFGWRSAEPSQIYYPPIGLHKIALGLVALAFLLMVVSSRNSRIRLYIRHPQLTGVAIWGGSHLLLNGSSRDIVLFGGIALWAVVEILAINKREGVWIKASPPSWGAEAITVLIAAVVIGAVIFIHPWLSGVSVW